MRQHRVLILTHDIAFAQVLLVLGLAYGGLRSSALSRATATPLFRMVVGLGLACGTLGYVAVGKLGGNADVWLLHWEARPSAGSLPLEACQNSPMHTPYFHCDGALEALWRHLSL